MQPQNNLLTRKELARELKRSIGYIDAMKRKGFKMPGGRTTLAAALVWLGSNPKPCKES